MAAKKETEIIKIQPVNMKTMEITIVGETPLIVHKWSEKAKKEIRDKQTGATKTKAREKKNIWAEMATACYWMDGDPNVDYQDWNEDVFYKYASNARFGFPVTAIKQAAASAVYRIGAVKDKMGVRCSFQIEGEGDYQLAQVILPEGELPCMREDSVKIGMGTADLRYRPQFTNWKMKLRIRYNANGIMSPEQIVNSINLAGQTNGIGEWRMERDGQYGQFRVELNG